MKTNIFTFVHDKVIDVFGDECTTEEEIIKIMVKENDDKIISLKKYKSRDAVTFHLTEKLQTPTKKEVREYIEYLQNKYNCFEKYSCLIE